MDSKQTASPSGNSNTVIQIVGEHNAVTITGVTALQLRSYDSDLFATAPDNPARAGEPGYTRTGRRETRILYPFNRTSLPLQGRSDLLGRLRDWLATPSSLSIQALIGGGGRGKTRLAVELLAEARSGGWIAGFAQREDLDVFRRNGCRTTWGAPTLVVIDYAAAKSAEITTWLRELVHDAEAPGAQPLRLLLLERLGGESVAWWREVFGRSDPEGEAVRDRLATGAPLTVGPLVDPQERHAVFAAAFRQANDAEHPPSRNLALDRALERASLGGDPLFLAMFGLTAARQGLDFARTLTADRIALDLAGQELERIGRIWQSHGLTISKDRPLHAHLAAVAALCEGMDESTSHDVIEREAAALHHTITQGTEPVRAALSAALPDGDGGIAAIQPDIIAEAAMILAWRALPDRGAQTVLRAAATGHRASVSRTIIRACQDFLIRGERGPLRWLQTLQAELPDLEALLGLADAMPNATIELRVTALELSETIVAIARELPGETIGVYLLASSLNNLSNRLSDLGRREAALQAIEEAVTIRRTLAAANPDAFLPDLASSLNNLSNRLSGLGRREAALQAIEEAVTIRRTLAAANPDAFLPDLASSLNNLSNRLSGLGRREAALQAIEEAVTVYRTLAAANPDAFLPDLASSLNNLSGCLSGLGRREAALQAIEEAVTVYRTLAAANPDAFLPDLASSLNNLSNRLSDLGRREAALQAIEEAVTIRRTLAAANPDAFLPDLASSLNNLSNRLSDLGRREAALQAIEEAVTIRRTLAAANPDAFLPDLAMSLGSYGSTLLKTEPAIAADRFAEGIEIICPYFLKLPEAFAGLTSSLCRDYIEACEAAGVEPNIALLAEIAAVFQRLKGENGQTN